MFNKDLEELRMNRDEQYNTWNEKYTRRNQLQNNWGWKMDMWAGRQNCGNHCHGTEKRKKELGQSQRPLGEGNSNPLQYLCLENPMDGAAWWAAVHGVAKNRTQLSDFTFTFHFHALEKEMATCSSVLAWRIPGTGERGGLPSVGSHRVGHDWSNLAAAAAAWRLLD